MLVAKREACACMLTGSRVVSRTLSRPVIVLKSSQNGATQESEDSEYENHSEYDDEEEEEDDDEWQDVYFIYLMINTFPRTKTHTYVGKDRKPRRKVMLHNSGGVKNARSARPAMGHWKLEMVIGPVWSHDTARRIRNEWRANSRGIEPRSKRGREIAKKYQLVCWDARLNPSN
jgi:hypothetical protein